MRLFKRLKDKKGFVIETSILFMIAIFSFCFLLSGLTISSHYRAKAENVKIEQQVADETREQALDEKVINQIIPVYTGYLSTVEVPQKESPPSEGDNQNQNNPDIEAPWQYSSTFAANFIPDSLFLLLNELGYSVFDIYDSETSHFILYVKTASNYVVWEARFTTEAEVETIIYHKLS